MELRYFDQNGGQLKLKVTGSDGKEFRSRISMRINPT